MYRSERASLTRINYDPSLFPCQSTACNSAQTAVGSPLLRETCPYKNDLHLPSQLNCSPQSPRCNLRVNALRTTMAPNWSSNTNERGNKPTGFFSLPRELRDKIYDLIWEKREQRSYGSEVGFIFRARVPRVRLLCRQFKSEYDQAPPVDSFIHVHNMSGGATRNTKIPEIATRSTRLKMSMSVDNDCCDAFIHMMTQSSNGHCILCMPSSTRDLQGAMDLVARLPLVQEVHIKLYVETAQNLDDIVRETIAYPMVTDLTIRSAEILTLETDEVVFAIWSRERGGFLLDNTEEKKATDELEAACDRLEERNKENESASRSEV